MHSISNRILILLTLSASQVITSGCGTTPPSSFYTLASINPGDAMQSPTGKNSSLHIGVGPVQFAEYLDRSQIVTRTNSTEVSLAETHRWAEPLHDNFGRILAENLSLLMATDKISQHPSRNWPEIDYQVAVNVWQFDADKLGNATLVANWNIRGKGGAELLTIKKSIFSTDIATPATYADIVRALSKTVELLSREIAAAITAEHRR